MSTRPRGRGPRTFGSAGVGWIAWALAACALGMPSASAVETWVVDTRACSQEAGSDPWPSLAVSRRDGAALRPIDPAALPAAMAGRPVVALVHGNNYTGREAIEEGLEVRARLEALGGLQPDTVFVVFDWPSDRQRPYLIGDLNEKARRSRVAGYHLARVLQAAPAGSRVCLMGQSDGARVALTAAHLLAGAELGRMLDQPAERLSSGRPDLRLRLVLLEAAAAHHWLDPGQRLEAVLASCEALLNLRNRRDKALAVYAFGRYRGMRPALGRVGLKKHDLKALGPLACRVEDINHHPFSGRDHTTFAEALAYPPVADRIAVYTSWGPIPPADAR